MSLEFWSVKVHEGSSEAAGMAYGSSWDPRFELPLWSKERRESTDRKMRDDR